MKRFSFIMTSLLAILICHLAIHAQTTGSISGTVTDATGALVPGATVTVKGEAGQKYTAVANSDGVYTIPGVTAGTPTYTLSISAPNFKTSVIRNVKVDVATPATVNAVLQAGNIEETVVITSGGEVLQTGTATVDFLKAQVPDAKLKLFPNIDNAYLELATGRVDAAVHDTPNVQYYANTAGKGRVKVVGSVKSGDFYGIAFPKGSDLVPQVNKALATLKANGQYDAIYTKWFGKKP